MITPDPNHDELLLAYLKDRDVHCPLCQYNLRNLTITTCPECGKGIELAVRAREVSVQSWAVMTVALSLPAGVGILFIFLSFREGLPPSAFMHPLIPWSCMGALPLAVAAFVLRRSFLRLSSSAQRGFAAATICGVVVLFYFLLQTIR